MVRRRVGENIILIGVTNPLKSLSFLIKFSSVVFYNTIVNTLTFLQLFNNYILTVYRCIKYRVIFFSFENKCNVSLKIFIHFWDIYICSSSTFDFSSK